MEGVQWGHGGNAKKMFLGGEAEGMKRKSK